MQEEKTQIQPDDLPDPVKQAIAGDAEHQQAPVDQAGIAARRQGFGQLPGLRGCPVAPKVPSLFIEDTWHRFVQPRLAHVDTA